jgi:hypothetical protein
VRRTKWRRPPVRAALAVALVAGVLTLFFGPADASDQEVRDIKAVIESPVGLSRRLVLFENLRARDTAASRQALLDLADSADDPLAVCALATLGRADQSGGEGKLKSVLASSSRSDVVRCGALVALAVLNKNRGRSWAQTRGDIESRSGSNQRLADQAEAIRAELWGEE